MATVNTVAATSASVRRFMSPGLEVALQQFADPALLAAGHVNIIALDAVVERFGTRWPARREHVHEHVATVLHRQLGSRGYHLRISDTDFLVCQPDLGRLAGQALCLRLLREILAHFLGGDGEVADVAVHEVLDVAASGVEARRVDVRGALEGDSSETIKSAAAPTPDPSLGGAIDIWTPFVGSNGREIEVSSTLEPIIELKGGKTIGVRFMRRVSDRSTGVRLSPAEVARLSRTDRLRIDLGGIVQALDLLRSHDVASPPLTLIIPVSFSSLPNLDARARIVRAFQEARRYAREGVICELCEIEGVPAATLTAAASFIRPHCLFVVGRVTELTRQDGQSMRDAGLRAVCVERPSHEGDAVFLGWAKDTIARAKHAAKGVFLYRLKSERERHFAQALGATHGSVVQP